FAVLRAAALSVDQALGTVYDGTDASCNIQIALGAGVAAALCQRHSVMASVIQRIAGGEYRLPCQIRNRLDTQAAGDHEHILRTLRDHILELLLRLNLVAEKIYFRAACDGLALFRSKLLKFSTVRFIHGFKFLEALVAGNDKQVVFIGQ